MDSKQEVVFIAKLNTTECDCITINEYKNQLLQCLKNNTSDSLTLEILEQAASNLPKSEVEYFKSDKIVEMTKDLTYAGVNIPPKSETEIRLMIAFMRLSNPACDYCNKKQLKLLIYALNAIQCIIVLFDVD